MNLKPNSFILYPFLLTFIKTNNTFKNQFTDYTHSSSNIFLACPPLKYGENCSELCGNCFDNLPCNHIDGTCMKGCQEGFRGQRCRTSKSAV